MYITCYVTLDKVFIYSAFVLIMSILLYGISYNENVPYHVRDFACHHSTFQTVHCLLNSVQYPPISCFCVLWCRLWCLVSVQQ